MEHLSSFTWAYAACFYWLEATKRKKSITRVSLPSCCFFCRENLSLLFQACVCAHVCACVLVSALWVERCFRQESCIMCICLHSLMLLLPHLPVLSAHRKAWGNICPRFWQVQIEVKGCSPADSQQLFRKRRIDGANFFLRRCRWRQCNWEERLMKNDLPEELFLIFKPRSSCRSGLRLHFSYNHQAPQLVISTMLSNATSIDLWHHTTVLSHHCGHYCCK